MLVQCNGNGEIDACVLQYPQRIMEPKMIKLCNSSIQFYSPGGLLRLLLRSFAAMVCKDQEDPEAAGPRLPPCLRGVV